MENDCMLPPFYPQSQDGNQEGRYSNYAHMQGTQHGIYLPIQDGRPGSLLSAQDPALTLHAPGQYYSQPGSILAHPDGPASSMSGGQIFAVKETCLDKLLRCFVCIWCHKPTENISKSLRGGCLYVTVFCASGHEIIQWSSHYLEYIKTQRDIYQGPALDQPKDADVRRTPRENESSHNLEGEGVTEDARPEKDQDTQMLEKEGHGGEPISAGVDDVASQVVAEGQQTFEKDPASSLSLQQAPSAIPVETVKPQTLKTEPAMYPCKICEKRFSLKCHLKIHEHMHKRMNVQRVLCRNTSRGHSRHVKIHYFCQTCRRRFSKMRQRQAHQRFCKGAGEKEKSIQQAGGVKKSRYKCRFCLRSFQNSSRYQQHKQRHLRQGPEVRASIKSFRWYKQTIGQLASRTQSEVTGTSPIQTLQFSCQVCGKVLASTISQRVHNLTHREPSNHPCSFCPREFSDGTLLKKHLAVHNQERPHQCKFCSKVFAHPSNCQQHERVHQDDRPYQCQFCEDCFETEETRVDHVDESHSGEQTVKCEFCSKDFLTKKACERHTKRHLPPGRATKKYKSSKDGFDAEAVATGGDKLQDPASNLHSLREEREEIIKPDDQADQKFVCKSAQNSSCEIPTAQFSCKFCGKISSSMSNLAAHEQLHSGIMQYKCRFCPESFVQLGVLQWHEKNHQFTCDICAEEFFASDEHIKKHLTGTESDLGIGQGASDATMTIDDQNLELAGGQTTSDSANTHMNTKEASMEGVDLDDATAIMDSDSDGDQDEKEEKDPTYHPSLDNTDEMGSQSPKELVNNRGGGSVITTPENADEDDDDGLQCLYCKKIFGSKRSVKRHLKNYVCRPQMAPAHRDDEEDRKCQYCKKVLSTPTWLKYHLRIHTGGGQTTIDSATTHVSTKETSMEGPNLDDATAIMDSDSDGDKDEKEEKDPTYHPSLDNSFGSITRVISSDETDVAGPANLLRSHKSPPVRAGSQSPKEVANNRGGASAITTFENPNEDDNDGLQCLYCKRIFQCKQNVKRHLKKYVCRPHMAPAHRDDEENRKCQYCKKVLSSPTGLKYHLRIHTGERPYKCRYCGKSFIERKKLKYHERVHTGEKPFSCSVCGRKFTLKNQCQMHLASHSEDPEERPFKCNYCDKHFKNARVRNKHESKVHKDIKLFPCEHCSKKFLGRAVYNKHMRAHKREWARLAGNVVEDSDTDEGTSASIAPTDTAGKSEKTKVQKTVVVEGNCGDATSSICQGEVCDSDGKQSYIQSSSKKRSQEKRPKDRSDPRNLFQDQSKCTHQVKVIEAGGKTFPCKYCEQVFKSQSDLTPHVRLHEKRPEFPCTHCDKSFSDRDIHDLHVRSIHSGGKPFKCRYCDQAFPDMEQRDTHHSVHAADLPHGCRLCEMKFVTQSECESHEQLHTLRPHKCEFCDVRFSFQEVRDEHKLMCTSSKPRDCLYCGKHFETWQLCQAHVDSHPMERPWQCSICGKSFKWQHQLNYHTAIHTKGTPHLCELCGKSFKTEKYARNHRRRHTAPARYKCSYCDRMFKKPEYRKAHERVHTGAKPYKCNYCDTWLSSITSRNHHHLRHTGEKPYKCTYCDHRSRHNGALKRHMRTHTGEKPYKCELCGEYFRETRELRNHELRQHTGERPHVCQFCGKDFMDRAKMMQHEKMHRGEKPLKCRYCEQCFVSSSARIYHSKRHHPEEYARDKIIAQAGSLWTAKRIVTEEMAKDGPGKTMAAADAGEVVYVVDLS